VHRAVVVELLWGGDVHTAVVFGLLDVEQISGGTCGGLDEAPPDAIKEGSGYAEVVAARRTCSFFSFLELM
jgi:hypothetical protein